MAFNTTSGQQAMSEINVTPLVDVMLVLLVIFIVTAPLLMQAVPVKLPKTNTTVALTKNTPLLLTIDANGHYFLDRQQVEPEALERALLAKKATDDTVVQINADQAVPYGSVAKALAVINNAGIRRLTFVSIRG